MRTKSDFGPTAGTRSFDRVGRRPVSRPWRWLAALPVLGVLSAPYVANRVDPRIFGLPFLLAFITGWVLLTSLVMAVILVLDDRADRAARTPTEPGGA